MKNEDIRVICKIMDMLILYKYLFKASALALVLSIFPDLYGQSKVDDNYINSSNKSTSILTKSDLTLETGDLNSYARQGSSFLFYSNGSCLRLTICTPQIVRFEFSGNGHFITSVIDISKKEWQPATIDFNESENQLEITTGMLAIIINKKPLGTVALSTKEVKNEMGLDKINSFINLLK